MGAKEYGALCRRYAEKNDMSQSALARELVIAFAVHEGEKRAFDAGAVSDMFKGKRKFDPPLFYWLNQILGIPQAVAEAAMLEHYRRFRTAGAVGQAPASADATTPGKVLMNPLALWPAAQGAVTWLDEVATRRTRRQRRERRERRRLEPAA